jgi:hypothetical protein
MARVGLVLVAEAAVPVLLVLHRVRGLQPAVMAALVLQVLLQERQLLALAAAVVVVIILSALVEQGAAATAVFKLLGPPA